MLSACATTRAPDSDVPASERLPAAEAPETAPATDPDVMYHVMAGEVQGHAGDFEKSSAEYLAAALESEDPAIARRATQVAISSESWLYASMAADNGKDPLIAAEEDLSAGLSFLERRQFVEAHAALTHASRAFKAGGTKHEHHRKLVRESLAVCAKRRREAAEQQYKEGLRAISNKLSSEAWSEALALHSRAVDMDPTFHLAMFQIGSCHLALNNARDALSAFQKTALLSPRHEWAYHFQAEALFRLANDARAASLGNEDAISMSLTCHLHASLGATPARMHCIRSNLTM